MIFVAASHQTGLDTKSMIRSGDDVAMTTSMKCYSQLINFSYSKQPPGTNTRLAVNRQGKYYKTHFNIRLKQRPHTWSPFIHVTSASLSLTSHCKTAFSLSVASTSSSFLAKSHSGSVIIKSKINFRIVFQE